jgi:hypothetical protein
MGSTYELVAKLGGGSAAYYDVISPSTSLDIVSPDSAVPTVRPTLHC